jgi:hypothetical protein
MFDGDHLVHEVEATAAKGKQTSGLPQTLTASIAGVS